jgi:hypothetical protein
MFVIMAKRQVFYSFHYKNDVRRVAQIRNIGAIEDNKPVSENAWEEVKKKGDKAVEKWIDDNMKYRSCVIVLVGEETAKRKWVKYEIKKAWNEGKGLLGIYIHNIKDPLLCRQGKSGKCNKGDNPFEQFKLNDGTKLSSIVTCYNPFFLDAYNEIKENLEDWIKEAINVRKQY